MNQRTSKWIK